jgi:hypothetical protein
LRLRHGGSLRAPVRSWARGRSLQQVSGLAAS